MHDNVLDEEDMFIILWEQPKLRELSLARRRKVLKRRLSKSGDRIQLSGKRQRAKNENFMTKKTILYNITGKSMAKIISNNWLVPVSPIFDIVGLLLG